VGKKAAQKKVKKTEQMSLRHEKLRISVKLVKFM